MHGASCGSLPRSAALCVLSCILYVVNANIESVSIVGHGGLGGPPGGSMYTHTLSMPCSRCAIGQMPLGEWRSTVPTESRRGCLEFYLPRVDQTIFSYPICDVDLACLCKPHFFLNYRFGLHLSVNPIDGNLLGLIASLQAHYLGPFLF